MLGYLFKRDWVDQHPALAQGFKQAVFKTKQRLQNDADDRRWTRIRPLMKATDDATFAALRSGYLEGMPVALDDAQISSAQRFYMLIDQRRKTPTHQPLDASLFRLQP
jgi:NitT/TauT family transport system substrate-binding protein